MKELPKFDQSRIRAGDVQVLTVRQKTVLILWTESGEVHLFYSSGKALPLNRAHKELEFYFRQESSL